MQSYDPFSLNTLRQPGILQNNLPDQVYRPRPSQTFEPYRPDDDIEIIDLDSNRKAVAAHEWGTLS